MKEVLRYFGADADAKLGEGGEAVVFGLDGERILRVHRAPTGAAFAAARMALLDDLNQHRDRVSFAIPRVLEVAERGGHVVSIETRLPGRVMSDVLATGPADRDRLLENYLEASRQIARLTPGRPYYGDLLREAPIRCQSFRAYAQARAADSLRRAPGEFGWLDSDRIAAAFGDAPQSLVHMDFFPGNVLVEGREVSAVLDFGAAALIGDSDLDAIGAVAYLDPLITPGATHADRDRARDWLDAIGLLPRFEPVRRWLAAFWSAAADDVNLNAWCRGILQDSQ